MEQLSHHESIYTKLNKFHSSGKIPHIILHGYHGTGKKTILNWFINKIYAFEPNYYLYKTFLKNISKKDSNIFVKNFALGNKNEDKFFYMPYYKSTFVHYFSSIDKEYIYQSNKMTF
jgi:DNA polymerase III delta prime subunit